MAPAGQYAATWALAHTHAVSKLVLLDMPLNKEVRMPTELGLGIVFAREVGGIRVTQVGPADVALLYPGLCAEVESCAIHDQLWRLLCGRHRKPAQL